MTSNAIIQKQLSDNVKSNYSNIVHEAATIQAIFKFTCGYRALYTCTKRLEQKKCAAGAKKLNTRAKTNVSGA